jgi:cytochrome c peroxidase
MSLHTRSTRAARGVPCVLAAALAAAAACRERSPSHADAEPPLASHVVPFTPPPAAVDSPVAVLGRLLFFDTRLSGDATMSCGTCHDPGRGFVDRLPKGQGHDGIRLARNVPSVVNVDARAPFFWDGRAATAEEQALAPMKNPDEMAANMARLLATLSGIPEYVARFKAAFGDSAITEERLAKALAAYERTLVSADSPFDRYLLGDEAALSAQAAKGYTLFTGRARCVACHDGPHFTDASFHNIGIKGDDVGRYGVVPVAVLKGAFKTPGLRDVALTPPYFHDGSAATLADVVEHYDRGGDTSDNLDKDIQPLHLAPDEKAALVAFMSSLTGRVPPQDAPRVPRVVNEPHARSTRELMKSVDGMLSQLDKLIQSLDAGDWEVVRESAERLTENAEELATMRMRETKPERRTELVEKLGALIVQLRVLDSTAVRRSRPDAIAAYSAVRDCCEDCHDAFRWKGRKAR